MVRICDMALACITISRWRSLFFGESPKIVLTLSVEADSPTFSRKSAALERLPGIPTISVETMGLEQQG
jgi:hypothetical protein